VILDVAEADLPDLGRLLDVAGVRDLLDPRVHVGVDGVLHHADRRPRPDDEDARDDPRHPTS
jgi:hypothetical protein